MSTIHGKNAKVTVDGDDLSPFTNSTEFKPSVDSHDTTCYGATGHVYAAGLTDGTFTIKGVYDDGATGPEAVLLPLLGGANVPVVYQPEGTGTGKPTRTFDAQITSYEESAPVAEMIAWTAEFQISGAVVATTQV